MAEPKTSNAPSTELVNKVLEDITIKLREAISGYLIEREPTPTELFDMVEKEVKACGGILTGIKYDRVDGKIIPFAYCTISLPVKEVQIDLFIANDGAPDEPEIPAQSEQLPVQSDENILPFDAED
jgi:hypothetical protein